jgi:ATP-dependent Clp protease ATP-binding subunit ClpB
MKFDKLTIKAQEALSEAQSLAQEGSNQVVDIPHVLVALLAEGGIPTQILGKLGVNTAILREIAQREIAKLPKVQGESDEIYLSREVSKAFKAAEKEARSLGDEYISTEHLLLGIAEEATGDLKNEFKRLGITRDSILRVLKDVRGDRPLRASPPRRPSSRSSSTAETSPISRARGR